MQNIILIQTDTTVGFISKNSKRLSEIKSREADKPFIKIFNSLKSLKKYSIRVPSIHKNLIRKSKKKSFILKNKSFRIDKSLPPQIIRNLDWYYSTSANEKAKTYDDIFCKKNADIIIENRYGYSENKPSNIYKLSKTKIQKIR